MIWMNGGPGSSSQLGNLLEMGPIMLDQNTAKLYWNNNTWAREINILYLDQPIGTGFSYIQDDQDLPTNMNGVAAHVWTALQNLYLNPNGCLYGLNMTGVPLFIAGESYAGKYAPAITEFIHKQQKAPVSPLKLNLKGMMIVDGFTDPYSTLAQMGMYAFQLGLIDYQERMRVEGYILQGLYLIDSNQMTEAKYMFNDALEHIMSYAGDVNAYNIRLFNVTV